MTDRRRVRRTIRRALGPLALGAVLAACTGGLTPSSGPSDRPAGSGAATGSAEPSSLATLPSDDVSPELVSAARAEGTLSVIGLSHDWCGYGDALDTFATRYGITLNELNPDATFVDQVAAIKTAKDDPGAAPDVIDVGVTFAAQAKAGKLLVPYQVAAWKTIPAAVKDADGAWTGDYYGVLAFETNKTVGAVPPTDWADLLDPTGTRKVALAGDPRVSTQAIQAVYAASLANGGSLDDAQPGLAFFANLKKSGALLGTIATPDTIDFGATPTTIRWTYNALAHRAVTAGDPDIDVTVPATGRLAAASAQAISAFAAHPNAAKLWLEFLYSDEGQNIWLKANCLPVRLADLLARDAVPQDVLTDLPDVSGAQFPTLAQLNAATTLITTKWDSVVGLDIK